MCRFIITPFWSVVPAYRPSVPAVQALLTEVLPQARGWGLVSVFNDHDVKVALAIVLHLSVFEADTP
jgi:hypothetical protein